MNELEPYEIDILIVCVNDKINKLESTKTWDEIMTGRKERSIKSLLIILHKLEGKKLNL